VRQAWQQQQPAVQGFLGATWPAAAGAWRPPPGLHPPPLAAAAPPPAAALPPSSAPPAPPAAALPPLAAVAAAPAVVEEAWAAAGAWGDGRGPCAWALQLLPRVPRVLLLLLLRVLVLLPPAWVCGPVSCHQQQALPPPAPGCQQQKGVRPVPWAQQQQALRLVPWQHQQEVPAQLPPAHLHHQEVLLGYPCCRPLLLLLLVVGPCCHPLKHLLLVLVGIPAAAGRRRVPPPALCGEAVKGPAAAAQQVLPAC
jgi:hypothetical protein